MLETIAYKIIEKKDLPQIEQNLLDFYNRYFPNKSNQIIIKNCSVFFVAIKNNEVIGVCRMLTDFSRYAVLLDLIVRKLERKKGIGSQITRMATSYCKNKNIKHLILTTDPRDSSLTSFYQKLGFKIVTNQFLMEFSV